MPNEDAPIPVSSWPKTTIDYKLIQEIRDLAKEAGNKLPTKSKEGENEVINSTLTLAEKIVNRKDDNPLVNEVDDALCKGISALAMSMICVADDEHMTQSLQMMALAQMDGIDLFVGVCVMIIANFFMRQPEAQAGPKGH